MLVINWEFSNKFIFLFVKLTSDLWYVYIVSIYTLSHSKLSSSLSSPKPYKTVINIFIVHPHSASRWNLVQLNINEKLWLKNLCFVRLRNSVLIHRHFWNYIWNQMIWEGQYRWMGLQLDTFVKRLRSMISQSSGIRFWLAELYFICYVNSADCLMFSAFLQIPMCSVRVRSIKGVCLKRYCIKRIKTNLGLFDDKSFTKFELTKKH